MAHLGKFISEILQNAGYDIEANGEALGTVLALDTDIPDAAATHLKSNLLTVESAKNNADIKKHFTAQALNTVDTTLSEFATAYGEIPADKMAAINEEKSSYKKTTMMLNALKEVEAGKAGATGGDDATKQTLEARKLKIEELTELLNTSKTSHEQALMDVQSEAANKILSFAQNTELSAREYAQGDLDKSTNVLIARQIIDSHLKEMGAKVISGDDGSLKLVQASDPAMDFMLENNKISYGSLADKILGEKKLLKVSDGSNGSGGNKNNYNPNGNGGGNGGSGIGQETASMYDDQIAALTGGN